MNDLPNPTENLPILHLQPGAGFRLSFSANAARNMVALDLFRDGDIVLHVKPRPEDGDIVISDRRGGAWGKRVSLPCDPQARLDLRLRFDRQGAHLSLDGRAEVSLTRFDGLGQDLRAKIPRGVTLVPDRPAGLAPMSPAGGLSLVGQDLQALALHLPGDRAITAEAATGLRDLGLTGLVVPVPPAGPLLAEGIDLTILPLWSNGRDLWLRGRMPETDWRNLAPLAHALADPRVHRIAGRPVLVVGDRDLAPGGGGALRIALGRALGVQPILVLANSTRPTDPFKHGYDAALDFAPSPSITPMSEQMIAADLSLAPRDWPSVPVIRANWTGDGDRQISAQWLRARARRAGIGSALGCPLLVLDCRPGVLAVPDRQDDLRPILAQALRVRPASPAHGAAILLPPDPAAAQAALQAAAHLRRHFGAAPVLVAASEDMPPPDGEAAVLPLAQAPLALQQMGISRIAGFGTALPDALADFGSRQFPPALAARPDDCAALLDWACPERLRISVVVPTWQSARWLEKRLGSIFAQTESVHEVIVLDDASTDDTIACAERIAQSHDRALRVLRCPSNSGNVTHQWRLACEMASGDFLWIAEADDSADPRFLGVMADLMRRDPACILAFCDSAATDESGAPRAADRKPYYAGMGDRGMALDGIHPARDFARRFLAPRNLVLTGSAVLWRRACLTKAFAALGAAALDFRFAGDWQIYLQACDGEGTVAYCADALVWHRQHASSVIASASAAEHYAEIERIHARITRHFPDEPELVARLLRHREDLQRIWKVRPADH